MEGPKLLTFLLHEDRFWKHSVYDRVWFVYVTCRIGLKNLIDKKSQGFVSQSRYNSFKWSVNDQIWTQASGSQSCNSARKRYTCASLKTILIQARFSKISSRKIFLQFFHTHQQYHFGRLKLN